MDNSRRYEDNKFQRVMKKLILSLWVITLSLGVVHSRTYNNIINRIRFDLRDAGTSSTYIYSTATIINAITIVEDDIISYTKPMELQGRYSTTTVAGTQEYALPTDMLGIPERVSYYNTSSTSTFKRTEFWTLTGLDRDITAWEATTKGYPRKYYLRANKIGLVPIPSTSYSTTTWDTLQIDYIVDPTDVTTSTLSNVPFNTKQGLTAYHKLIILGVKAILTGSDILDAKYYILLEKMRVEVQARPDQYNTQSLNTERRR